MVFVVAQPPNNTTKSKIKGILFIIEASSLNRPTIAMLVLWFRKEISSANRTLLNATRILDNLFKLNCLSNEG